MKHTLFDERRKLRSKKFLGMPLVGWLILSAISVGVLAQVVGPALFSGQQQVQGVTLAFGTGVTGTIESNIAYNTPDDWQAIATFKGGYATATYVRVYLINSVTSVQLKCNDLVLAAGPILTMAEGLVNAGTALAIKEAGGLACTSASVNPAYLFDTTITRAADGTFFFSHTWTSFPSSNVKFVIEPLS